MKKMQNGKKLPADRPCFSDHMVNLRLVCQFRGRLQSLRLDVVRFINHFAEGGVVTLSTGEKAIDMDDAWLLIGRKGAVWAGGSPFLRDKRDQHIKDKDPDYVLPEPSESDKIYNWELERILDLAAKITQN